LKEENNFKNFIKIPSLIILAFVWFVLLFAEKSWTEPYSKKSNILSPQLNRQVFDGEKRRREGQIAGYMDGRLEKKK